MIQDEQIVNDLIASDSLNLPESFAAAAVQIDDNGVALHSGIIVKYQDESYLFHFNGRLHLEGIPQGQWYFHKIIDFIKPGEIISFLAYCKNISTEASPQYGYFYPGSYFENPDGAYFSDIDMPEYMTCVGFCINVLKGFNFGNDYISYQDWDINNVDQYWIDRLLSDFRRNQPDIAEDRLIEHIRRINPSEYISSAFFTIMPIRKAKIDTIVERVKAEIIIKRNVQPQA